VGRGAPQGGGLLIDVTRGNGVDVGAGGFDDRDEPFKVRGASVEAVGVIRDDRIDDTVLEERGEFLEPGRLLPLYAETSLSTSTTVTSTPTRLASSRQSFSCQSTPSPSSRSSLLMRV